jgi:hypothetical protein
MPFMPDFRFRSAAILMLAISSAAITGCAATYNSGIQEQEADAYFLSIRLPTNEGGSRAAKRQAVVQADEYCDGQTGRKASVTFEELGPVTADIYFTCSESIDL